MPDTHAELYLSPEAVSQLPGLVTLGAGCREVVARALARLPHRDRVLSTSEVAFVMVGPFQAEYLSESVLNGRNVVVLDDAILTLPEEDQAEIVLRQVAGPVLAWRDPAERPRDWDPLKVFSDDGKLDVALLRHELKLDQEELARRWLADWQAYQGQAS